MSNKANIMTPKKILVMLLPIVGAIFVACAAILYILYKSWSNKDYIERWKDYENCGEGL